MKKDPNKKWIEKYLSKEITPLEMREIDLNAKEYGVLAEDLMENAGKAVAEVVLNEAKTKGKIAIFCGPGNNGGDGFVAARYLARKREVELFLIGDLKNTSKEAEKNWKTLKKMKGIQIREIKDKKDLKRIKLADYTLIIDSILGIGVKGELREPIKALVNLINNSRLKVVSVDVPTGLNTSDCVKADITVTFHKPKEGFFQAKNNIGKLIVKDIGIPKEAELYLGEGTLAITSQKRKKDSHKGENGRLLIIGGSYRFSGAPALSGLSALRTGIDLVKIFSPESVASVIKSFSPNLIVIPLKGDFLSKENINEIEKEQKNFDSVLIGPGLGEEKETLEVCKLLIEKIKLPLIVDADALKVVKNIKLPEKCILTPHLGELGIILGKTLEENFKNQVAQVSSLARKKNVTILLKGSEDIISDGKKLKINRTGNPGMTVGGTGDVLSGIAGAFLARKIDPFWAACASAYLNGVCGNLAVKEKGYHILATDLIEKIPKVLKKFDKSLVFHFEKGFTSPKGVKNICL